MSTGGCRGFFVSRVVPSDAYILGSGCERLRENSESSNVPAFVQKFKFLVEAMDDPATRG
jgi:hypothetical protein